MKEFPISIKLVLDKTNLVSLRKWIKDKCNKQCVGWDQQTLIFIISKRTRKTLLKIIVWFIKLPTMEGMLLQVRIIPATTPLINHTTLIKSIKTKLQFTKNPLKNKYSKIQNYLIIRILIWWKGGRRRKVPLFIIL